MVKVLPYAYCIDVPLSRKLARRLEEDIAFKVLAANNTPDFRKDHLPALAGLFPRVLKLCQKARLVKLGHVALDGTKIKANASKHKAMSYKRMKKEEARLTAEVRELLQRAETVDEEENKRYNQEKRGDGLPEELAFKKSRLEKIREAKKALEIEAQQKINYEQKGATGTPPDKTQRNFTDPDSHIMPAPDGKQFIQAYNTQIAVDSNQQVIVAARLSNPNQPSDKGQAKPLVEAVKSNIKRLPRQVLADAGHSSKDALEGLSTQRIDVCMPPGKMHYSEAMLASPRGRIPKDLSTADRMRCKLRTKKGKEYYALRKQLPEPVFGQIKQARGFRQFSLRDIGKVSSEWQLACIRHNLLKLFGAQGHGLARYRYVMVA